MNPNMWNREQIKLELYSIAAAEAVAARSSTAQILKQEGMMREQSGT
jgi:hypothetical protein